MNSKLILIIISLLVLYNISLVSKEESNNNIKVYRFSEKKKSSIQQGFYCDLFLAIDFKNHKYQMNQINSTGDGGQFRLVSQGYLTTNKEQIKLIDKNNSIIFGGKFLKDNIILKTGIKYFRNKTFKKIDSSPGMVSSIITEFLNWNDKYYQSKKIKKINNDIYSGIYMDVSINGILIELNDHHYEMYFIDGNDLKFEISSGEWFKKDNKLQLKDDDKLNSFEMNILDKERICPTKRFPFAYDITPLKLKKK
jgi:hypothetical protein